MSKPKPPAARPGSPGREPRAKQRSNRLFWAMTFPLIILAGAALAALLVVDLEQSNSITTHPGSFAGEGGAAPAPWTYDPQTNRHWDPEHNHWHDGPPPEGVATPAPAPSPTPAESVEPWFHDLENNQHWNPVHNHWHVGPPPPPEEREATSPPEESTPE